MLVKATLESALNTSFRLQRGRATADVASELAQALITYSQAAVFASSVPAAMATRKAALEAHFMNAFTARTAAAFATAWSNALASLWTGLAVTGASGTGTIAGVPGAAALVPTLTALFVPTKHRTTASYLSELATAIDTATRTIVAPLVLPPAAAVVTGIA